MSDLTIYKNRTWTRRITFYRAGVPVDITGWTIELTIKQRTNDPDPPKAERTVGSGITLLAQSGDTLGQADARFNVGDVTCDAGSYIVDVAADPNDGTGKHEAIPPQRISIRDGL